MSQGTLPGAPAAAFLIRRVELRALEAERRARGGRAAAEFLEDDVAS